MRALVSLLAALALTGCESMVYKLPTRQGNVIEQKQLDKLALGMTREQVRYLLGTPLAASPLQNDRWTYVGYYKPPRGKASSRTIVLHFEGDQLARMEGVAAGEEEGVEKPDVDSVVREEEKERLQQERGEEPRTGVILGPEREAPAEAEPRETGEPRID